MMQSNHTTPEGVDSCGARLRAARELAGMSREQVSARLRMPVRVIEALESDDWARIGAPVFVRGQLRSYARLMGIDLEADLVQAQVGPVAPPELVSHTHVPRYRHVFEQATRRAMYIAITAVIAVPVWLATKPHLSNTPHVESLEVPAELATAEPAPSATPPRRTPLIASMGTMRSAPAQRPVEPALSLAFEGESWVQVFAPDGRSLEQGLLAEGDRRSYEPGEVGRVVLGNIAAVDVMHNGEPVDLAPFSRANVARFTLSSDGSLAPVVD
ncbi:hypothetical protein N799_00150 [Lysobacter arseniciresistens ZS79]|uniref:HTH cro/C1-type domain-containing protein n=1 Tax=Lysobacter arseniciresistens ZS79 TaxID=913325 RepID=A0A0A0F8C5_9GAMM|nr:helix-turn-helix domain-containing protein [Lysobacter arseniciresistens]KGM57642.1 hypothetical protein N799_00150 [Lysobacter arseniciresistens ZS79]